jgi:uncharacterized membrane protein YdjX (TVP38/TMEM64 family)
VSTSRVSVRFVTLVVVVAGLAATAALLPLHRIPDAVARAGGWAPAVAIGAGALLLAALVPRTAISIACGALFGALAGGAVGVGAALVAATVTFAVGRWLGRAALAAHTGDRLGRLDGWLARRGLLGVLVVRMMPLAPYGLIGYAYGTTGVRTRTYLAGTLLGATPSAFSYAAVGAAVVRPGAINLASFAPAAVGLVIAVAAFVYWRRSRRHPVPACPDRQASRVPEPSGRPAESPDPPPPSTS